MSKRLGLSILFLVLISACNARSKQKVQQINETLIVDGLERIVIDIKAGELIIQTDADKSFQIIGYVSAPDSFVIVSDGGQLEIIHENSSKEDQLQIFVPPNIELIINSFSADATLKNFSGNLVVKSTGGSIFLENVHGSAQIWSGRGDVTLAGGFGEAVIIGEHGVLTARNFSGDISMSSIMGSIEYVAPIKMNNFVRLETDHGPVSAILPADARATIEITSTSGDVNCGGQEFLMTFNGCTGKLGDGQGELSIRTVSGGVKFSIEQGQVVD